MRSKKFLVHDEENSEYIPLLSRVLLTYPFPQSYGQKIWWSFATALRYPHGNASRYTSWLRVQRRSVNLLGQSAWNNKQTNPHHRQRQAQYSTRSRKPCQLLHSHNTLCRKDSCSALGQRGQTERGNFKPRWEASDPVAGGRSAARRSWDGKFIYNSTGSQRFLSPLP